MATGKSSFARNYDKLLAALSVVLLAGAIFLWVSGNGKSVREKADFDRALASRAPAHPALDRDAATAGATAARKTLQRLESPFKMAVDEKAESGFFVPEARVWCVKCRKPIPFAAETCPLCGEEQPKKTGIVVDASLDSDGDGLPDIWERERGFNPQDPDDAGLDFDGDGFTNLEEFTAKTDPRDQTSHPDLMGYLRVSKVEVSRLPLMFKATNNMGGGNYKCQFNYTDRENGNKVQSLFVKVGDVVGPLDRLPGAAFNAPPRYADFKLVALEWRDEEVFNKVENRMKTVSAPVAIVERVSTGRKIEFQINKESSDSTYIVTFTQPRDNSEYVADGSVGEAEFKIGDDKFVLAGVDRESGVVKIRRLSDKKVFSIPRLEE